MKGTKTVQKQRISITHITQQITTNKIKDAMKTLKTGANDLLVVQQRKQGTYKTTPLHIR